MKQNDIKRLKSYKKRLKKCVKSLFFVLFGLSSLVLVAQEEQYYPPEVGLMVGYKYSINGFPNPQGRKNGIAFNNVPDVGVTAYLPLDFTYNLGLYVDLSYNTNSFLMKYDYVPASEEYLSADKMRFSYFSFSPVFNHSGFKLGFSVGVPLSADWEGVNISRSKLQTLIEIKAGYSYPLYYDRVGRLNVFVNATYAFNGIYKDFVSDDPLKGVVPAIGGQIITNYYNPRPASIQLGLNFLFNLFELPAEYYE